MMVVIGNGRKGMPYFEHIWKGSLQSVEKWRGVLVVVIRQSCGWKKSECVHILRIPTLTPHYAQEYVCLGIIVTHHQCNYLSWIVANGKHASCDEILAPFSSFRKCTSCLNCYRPSLQLSMKIFRRLAPCFLEKERIDSNEIFDKLMKTWATTPFFILLGTQEQFRNKSQRAAPKDEKWVRFLHPCSSCMLPVHACAMVQALLI